MRSPLRYYIFMQSKKNYFAQERVKAFGSTIVDIAAELDKEMHV